MYSHIIYFQRNQHFVLITIFKSHILAKEKHFNLIFCSIAICSTITLEKKHVDMINARKRQVTFILKEDKTRFPL